ncbi:hydantoinase/oxoprolinase N-terminal domain-containing protein [Psychrobacter glacincola]|uniref:hydantoinase/oxoprolinase N-terminal domain-containing protein n=1 Tax=Psychrobacter glacincola TaxID=56810 RepID=UPI003FD53338
MKNDFRIGVDAGGTFTDFVLAERSGNVHLFKAPSTPEDGTLAIANGLQQIATRDRRFPIRGRILADGTEHEPLNEQDILDAIKVLKQQDVQAVAISFVWSIRNTQHEQRAKELVEQHMPGVFVCCGSDVYPQIKEYTRISTTLVNAYLSPVMASYVHKNERDSHVELVNIEVSVIGKISKPKLPSLVPQQGDISNAKTGSREMLFDQSYDWIDTPIYDGEKFGAGALVTGPALIQEPTTTVVIKNGWQAELHETGTYKLTRAA